MRGPIDYIIVGFNGINFDGSVLKSLEEPINNGVIKINSTCCSSQRRRWQCVCFRCSRRWK